MMRKLFYVLGALTLCVTLSGCRNTNAKIGGTVTVDLPQGERLRNINGYKYWR